jgi:hypothetical protein
LIQGDSDLAGRAAAGCRALYKGKQQLEFFLHIPAELDMRKLELDLRAMLPHANNASIATDIV